MGATVRPARAGGNMLRRKIFSHAKILLYEIFVQRKFHMRGGNGSYHARMRLSALLAVSLLAPSVAVARPRPKLTPQATALLGAPWLLLPDDNLALALAPGAKPVPFVAGAPARLELVAAGPEPLLVVDDDLVRLRAGALALVAPLVGASPSASADASLIASIDQKRTLQLTRGEATKPVAYRHAGQWELERPWVAPDGRRVVVAVHDYTQALDAWSFVIVDAASGELVEVALSRTFAPGELRQPLGPDALLVQLRSEADGDDGAVALAPASLAVLDLKTKQLGPAPPSLRPGRASPDGRASLFPARVRWSDDKRCGAEETLLYEEGRVKPSVLRASADSVVTAIDFVPDGSAVVASVLSLKSCRSRGVIIPLAGDVKPAAWRTVALPSREKTVRGRVIVPAAAPAPIGK
jgi:hypothetical protein